MKKVLTLLTAMVCVFCLSACGAQKQEIVYLITEEQATQAAEGMIRAMDEMYTMGLLDQYRTDPELSGMIQPWLIPAVESWVAASEDFGDLVDINGYSVTYSGEDDLIVLADVEGTIRPAQVEIVVKDGITESVTVNVVYSFAEQMQKAGLNTLLGMGTVFSVLILISIIISLFKFIPSIQAAFSRKPAPAAPAPAAAPTPAASAPSANAAAAPAYKPGDVDDPALIAVISAAVAAYEGAAPGSVCYNPNVDTGDAYVVRTIRRISRA